MDDLIARLERFGSPKVALVGDFMLDRYVFGDAERISPEAPVPVLKAIRTECRTGGTANVAMAVLALGGKVICTGVIGQDARGEELLSILTTAGADISSLIRLKDRPTTVKTRYVGLAQHRHAQQMLRVDEETTKPVGEDVRRTLRAAIRGRFREAAIVAIEDYNKGLLDDTLTPELIAEAKKAGKAVIVDPAVISDYRRYRGATVLTPNRYEAALASGVEITDGETLKRAARGVLMSADAEAVVVTLDKQGAYFYTRDDEGTMIPTRPRNVYDVTGAGDEVLAMLAVALAEGTPLKEAAALANVAGGLEVERFGVVPIARQEVLDELRQMVGSRSGKVMDRAALTEEMTRRRQRGETIVFTNGCFDLLHMGHVRFLRQARQLGSCLVVAINSDEGIQKLKGPGRPVIGAAERAEMLSALECVDAVTVFPEATSAEVMKAVHPNIFAKGGSTPVVVERDIAEGLGAKVVTLDLVQGLSTTNIINRVLEAHGPK